MSEKYLWPELKTSESPLGRAEQSEIVATCPDRAGVPRDVLSQLLNSATEHVDILVYSGTFLTQTNPRIATMLADRAASAVEVRLCFARPDGSAVALRDEEEGIGGTLGSKVRASLSYFTDLVGAENCDIRLHNNTVYASLFRYDDQLLINPHILGSPSSANPVIHVRCTQNTDDMFDKYMSGFDRAWEGAIPWVP